LSNSLTNSRDLHFHDSAPVFSDTHSKFAQKAVRQGANRSQAEHLARIRNTAWRLSERILAANYSNTTLGCRRQLNHRLQHREWNVRRPAATLSVPLSSLRFLAILPGRSRSKQ